ncbi:isochorismate synthase [soil metagenome]
MRAVTRPADERERQLDLNDVAGNDGVLFVRNGVGLAGRGVALATTVDDVGTVLRTIEHDDVTGWDEQPGVGPVAVGTVPFLPGRPGRAIIPAVVMGKAADGRCWVTTIDGAADPLPAPGSPLVTVDSYRIDAVTPVEHYLDAVRAARDAVRNGVLVKAVIAREIRVTAGRPIDRHGLLHRLKAAFGSSYRFAVGELVGASPELLVEVDGRTVRSYPLAGTAPRASDPERDAELAASLIASTKNLVEHRAVIDMVHDTLLPWCSYLDWEPEPGVVRVANVQHLGTRIEGQLSRPVPAVTALVRALCPTPALGGSPGPEALALIAGVEGVERDDYGGAVGWMDAAGNGSWAVTIRCAQFEADRTIARLHAGGGIVADSDPDAELAETQDKFQAMLAALIRP